ncbi:hypothetical protein [Deinococcus apachensis]|uniref:hypothetical protein n=1 Tax=Deinococcus apachensis TaxID=309886 RepID=UPI00036208CB|nr:hypothetical protein [Deinococcus apachensis]
MGQVLAGVDLTPSPKDETMSDPKNLHSAEPIKSVGEIERETGGAATSTTEQEQDDRSLLGTLVAPFVSPDGGARQDSTTAARSETTENSEG